MNQIHDTAQRPRIGVQEGKRLELINEMLDCAKHELLTYGIPDQDAKKISEAWIERILDGWAGALITIPKDNGYYQRKREDEIYAKFDGRNYGLLAREYRMTERGMRLLLQRVHERKKEAPRG